MSAKPTALFPLPVYLSFQARNREGGGVGAGGEPPRLPAKGAKVPLRFAGEINFVSGFSGNH